MNEQKTSKMKTKDIFIAIDDDPINNLLSKVIIKKALPDATVYEFTEAKVALEFIDNEARDYDGIILFLDINMPIIDGWGFLERFERLSTDIAGKVRIYMLSSSLDENDVIRARSYASVEDYIPKPLTIEGVEGICSKSKAA